MSILKRKIQIHPSYYNVGLEGDWQVKIEGIRHDNSQMKVEEVECNTETSSSPHSRHSDQQDNQIFRPTRGKSILKRRVRLVADNNDDLKDDDNNNIDVKLENTIQLNFGIKEENIKLEASYFSSDSRPISNKAKSLNFKPESSVSLSAKGTKLVRNYAKALCSFAISPLAVPYLSILIEENFPGKVETHQFQRHIKTKKKKVSSISSFKKLLIVKKSDPEREKIHKKLFSEVSIIFLKCFAVNWIFSGKVQYKDEHLKFRHKMLRRVRNPELFN